MMFVAIRDPASTGKTSREFTDQISALWQTNFHNNHIDAKVFIVDDDRVLYMFSGPIHKKWTFRLDMKNKNIEFPDWLSRRKFSSKKRIYE